GYDDGRAFAAPVGSFPRDRSPRGALDMMGNVAEWCRHRGDEEPARDTFIFVRGGSYIAITGWVRGTQRMRLPAEARAASLGFRVSLDARAR
ncbi:MAG: formylglycine-generating enzyme family protein, partial [Planctomycetota bacterium]